MDDRWVIIGRRWARSGPTKVRAIVVGWPRLQGWRFYLETRGFRVSYRKV